jgi:hypothetical protein
MPSGTQQFNETQPISANGAINNGNGTSQVTALAVNQGPWRLDALICTNTDTVSHNVLVYITVGASQTLVASAAVPAGAGLAGAPSVDVLALGLPSTQKGMSFSAPSTLAVQTDVTVTSGKFIYWTLQGGYF